MTERTTFTSEEARRVGQEIGIDWTSAPFDLEQFRMGMDPRPSLQTPGKRARAQQRATWYPSQYPSRTISYDPREPKTSVRARNERRDAPLESQLF